MHAWVQVRSRCLTADVTTVRVNREAFTRWVIRPRPMTGVTDPKTNTEVLGIPLSVPVLTAPMTLAGVPDIPSLTPDAVARRP